MLDEDPAAASPASADDTHPDETRPRKRQRVRLSCLECRRRKLSCDRGFPCQRCTKSGTPERCQYEGQDGSVLDTAAAVAAAGASPVLARLGARPLGDAADVVIREAPRDLDRIRRMEYEIAALKTQLARQAAVNLDSSTTAAASTPGTQKGDGVAGARDTPDRADADKNGHGPVAEKPMMDMSHPDGLLDKELRFFRGKEFRTRYFGPANATMAFSELNGLCPFMKETAEEWLKPARLQERKDKRKRQDYQDIKFAMADAGLEALLPPREDTNALVTCYLDQFEQLHRIVHIPSFLRDYGTFWNGTAPRPAAMTALVLSMLAVSSSLHEKTPMRFVGTISTARYSAGRWIEAVERWHGAQSYKHRRLIHYQIMCMLYLGKRVNTIKKKKFWTGSGSLIQDGIAVGLHREPAAMNNRISPFNQEMRRRIWATIQEFDMQASFDYGLPTLLSQVHFDVAPPANLDDDQFDEDSAQLPASRPVKEYTYSSYQHLARQSLPLRLELSRILSGPPGETEYDMVQRYTNDLMQEIDALPSWEAVAVGEAAKKPLLAYTLLHIQLRQYILPLHQPYLKLRKATAKYQYSEIIYYNAARDMVLLHEKLYEQGMRTLNFLREDALTMAINLCSVTMLQPRGSTNMIMINAQNTVALLKQCIEMKRDRLLRCGNNEPWGFCIMCSALGLLQAHLGIKTAEQAKQCASEHFMNLHYKILANQVPEPLIPVDLPNLPYPLEIDMTTANPAAAAAIMAQSWALPVSSTTTTAGPSASAAGSATAAEVRPSCSSPHSHAPSRPSCLSSSSSSSAPPAPSAPSAPTTATEAAAVAAAVAAAAATAATAPTPLSSMSIAAALSCPLPPSASAAAAVAAATRPSAVVSPHVAPALSSTLSLPDPLFSPSPELTSGTLSATGSSTPASASAPRFGVSVPVHLAGAASSSYTPTAAAAAAAEKSPAGTLPPADNPLLRQPLLQGQSYNADFSLELLGLNFQEIWGDSWHTMMNGP